MSFRSRVRNLPIRRKLSLVVLVTVGMALLLTCTALFIFELAAFRRSLKRDLGTLAGIIGQNSVSPLVFNDRTTAEEVLASLRAEEQIAAGAIYASDGELFASYRRPENPFHLPALPGPDGHLFAAEFIRFTAPVVELRSGERVGTILLVADYQRMRERLFSYAGIMLFALAGSFVAAVLLSARLQRVVSDPILNLARTARAISGHQDYSVRAEKLSEDELGVFVDAFNQMLTRIQEQNLALHEARDELEARVEERTEELKRQADELARSNADLEQFAYVASHDLQEPLRMVSNYTQLLGRRYKDQLDQDAHDFIGYAVDGAVRMQGLINDLLQYSRVGTRGKDFSPVDCAAVFDAAIANLRHAIDESGATITRDELPTLRGDSAQLALLFQNLIGNALKFRGEAPPRIHVGVRREGEEWAFAVQDNGIGIDLEYKDRIFVIFQRLHSLSKYPGTGIGLAICKKIVERHGGRMRVESTVGEGSRFSFTIPVASNQLMGHD